WLLADPDAWRSLGATNFKRFPRKPEETWGHAHDPDSGHPKQVFARVCDDNDVPENSDTRASLAEVCDLKVLAQRVPVSYPDFAQRV
ncbi:hypothetical protein NL473_28595, partial [Klebsiella pneumoniae]|nr:hypothetical protein [Klebsiella pneumoniae]MCP6594585.1 hypothetical protein [Klebsiella pneumoniae]